MKVIECTKCGEEIREEGGVWREVREIPGVGMTDVCMAIPGDDTHEPVSA